jgi:hypothetical protein
MRRVTPLSSIVPFRRAALRLVLGVGLLTTSANAAESTPVKTDCAAIVRGAGQGDPALGAEARLVLAQRQLRADVDLQPRRAHWPSDPIDARVVVSEPSGRTDVADEKISIEALLDLTPLPVAWEQRGTTWTGRIAPRPTAGPSVVRVVVKDAGGSEIGRGFLEIDTPKVRLTLR